MSAEGFGLKHSRLCSGFKARWGLFMLQNRLAAELHEHHVTVKQHLFWWYHLVMLQRLKEKQRVPAQPVTSLSWKLTQTLTEKLLGFLILGSVEQFYCSVVCFVFKYDGLSSVALLIWSCCSARYFTSILAPLFCAAVPVLSLCLLVWLRHVRDVLNVGLSMYCGSLIVLTWLSV